MKKRILLITSAILTVVVAWALLREPTPPAPEPIPDPIPTDTLIVIKGNDYAALWDSVEAHEKNGYYQDALNTIERIYQSALQEKNPPQIAKAVLARMKNARRIEEDLYVSTINDLEVLVADQPAPNKQFLHGIIAQVYAGYYNDNYWRISQRTETGDYQEDDMRTWTVSQIGEKIIDHFLASLTAPEHLQKIDIDSYKAVLTEGNTHDQRPTLYDFLAHQAIDHLADSKYYVTQPQETFTITDADWFGDVNAFLKMELSETDSLNGLQHAAHILQDLLRYRAKYDQPTALLDANLKRLRFASIYYKGDGDKNERYRKALEALLKKHKNGELSAEVNLQLARHYMATSHLYDAKTDSAHRFDKAKAKAICEKVIQNHPDTYASDQCSALLEEIELEQLAFTAVQYQTPDFAPRITVTHRNLSTTKATIYRLPQKWTLKNSIPYQRLEYLRTVADFDVVWEKDLPLTDPKDYRSHQSEFPLEKLSKGSYLVALQGAPKDSMEYLLTYKVIHITNLNYVTQSLENNDMRVKVFDRMSGNPVGSAKLQLFERRYNYDTRKTEHHVLGNYTTDAKGEVILKQNGEYRSFSILIEKGEDIFYENHQHSQYKKYESKPRVETRLFLDRSIYRPGQTVYFKGIVFEEDGFERKIKPHKKVTIQLYDVNRQSVWQETFTTNEYGSYHGSVSIPSGLLNGQMYLHDGQGRANFSVEEYKRPKFEVSIDPVKGNFKLGEQIKVTGQAKSYAGSNIDGATVAYRVRRTARFPYYVYWRYGFYPQSYEKEIVFDTVVTAKDGTFEIIFDAEPDEDVDVKYDPIFTYAVSADVTDINGETRSAYGYVSAGNKALELSLGIPDVVEASARDTFNISANNLNGQPVPTKGTLKVWRLKQPKTLLRSRLLDEPEFHALTEAAFRKQFPYDQYKNEWDTQQLPKGELVQEQSFDTEKSKAYVLNQAQRSNPGIYLVELTAKDAFGKEVKTLSNYTVFSAKSDKMPVNKLFWSYHKSGNYQPGDVAEIYVGSAADAVFYYQVETKNGLTDPTPVKVNNKLATVKVPIKAEYRGNVAVHVFMASKDRVFTQDYSLGVPYSNKQLDISFETFRDKLLPGQEEEWRIRIKNGEGEAAIAEVLATMYDASLDAFRGHSVYFNPWQYFYSGSPWRNHSYNLVGRSNAVSYTHHSYSPRQRNYPILEIYGYNGLIRQRNSYRGFRGNNLSYSWSNGEAEIAEEQTRLNEGAYMVPGAPSTGAFTVANDMDEDGNIAYSAPLIEKEEGKETSLEGVDDLLSPPDDIDLGNVALRRNFNETAFFYPDLKTDENGDVLITFTIPEALTRWKFSALAHTKDLATGIISEEVVTQKKLMILPNPPRFFREGDQVVFSAKISNLSDEAMNGQAELRMFDAVTMQPVDAQLNIKAKQQAFKANKGESTNLSWSLTIPEGIPALTYQIVAKAGNFSDGEERPIPVLTNRMLVTEALPLPVRKGGTHAFALEKLKNNRSTSLKHHKVTLEFTANPAWYAVQSLPYMMEYPYECAEQTFSRFYANSLGAHIMNVNPKIKRVFDQWQTASPESFLSKLEQNQELKSAMLEETPWVAEAQDEAERKRRLALLFDLNKMNNQRAGALNKLQKMQASNGGWPWFEGGPDNRYITQHIVTGMGHLEHLGGYKWSEDGKSRRMVIKAVKYLDNRIDEDFLRAQNDDDYTSNKHINYLQVQYLYARSYFDQISMSDGASNAKTYYLDQAREHWKSFNLYNQGMLALALKRYGDQATADKIMKSIKQRALYSDEMGMYWKDNLNGGFYWYQAPIETQALLIEAFDEVSKDQKSVEEMKVWLLKQKQTQNWPSTKATTEAVYALLLRGTDILTETEIPEITIGNIQIIAGADPGNGGPNVRYVGAEAGTGYIKTSFDGSEVKPDMANVVIERSASQNTVAWGAMYWQYFEDLDKITPAETPLKLEKKLFVRKNSDRGAQLQELKQGEVFQPGDLVTVRIVLRTDRRLEYVHMKDQRASCFEPVQVLSSYRWQDGLGYYQSTKDASTNFFFDNINKGTYVFEYDLRVGIEGDFSNGITTIQCMYAPEFTAHSEGIRVKVKK